MSGGSSVEQMWHIVIILLYLQEVCRTKDIQDDCPAMCFCDTVRSRPSRRPDALDLVKMKCNGGKKKITALEELTLKTSSFEIIYLDVSENKILTLHQYSFVDVPSLQKLNLSRNQVFLIEEESFANLTNLKRLDLSGNRLKIIKVPMFQGLQNLEKLKLSQNIITTIYEGAFDDLISIRQLDISSNPLHCNCELRWLLDWAVNTSVKLTPSPKCGSPPSLKGEPVRKLDVDTDFHCDWPGLSGSLLELSPLKSQVVFKGDNLHLHCRTLSASILVSKHGEPQIIWSFEGRDSLLASRNIQVENHSLSKNGLIESSVYIEHLAENHTGRWDCHLMSEDRNETRSIVLIVISEETVYCPPAVTSNNKGVYIWPKTIARFSSDLPCEGVHLGVVPMRPPVARHFCNSEGFWEDLNTTECSYISETTKMLEQFSKVNLSLTTNTLLESAVRLRNFTGDGKQLKDKMDIVYLSRTIEKYLSSLTLDKELGSALSDIVNIVIQLPKDRLIAAQFEDKSCSRFVKIVESIARLTSAQVSKKNFAVEEFHVKRDSFTGITCTCYSNTARNIDRLFHCSTSNATLLTGSKAIDASIQVPSSLFYSLDKFGVHAVTAQQLIFSMYENNNFFPRIVTQPDEKDGRDVTSCIVGVKLANVDSFYLAEPVYVMLRMRSFDESVRPVWWNETSGKWHEEGCYISDYLNEMVVFRCQYLGYYGLLQDTYYYPDDVVRLVGAKFKYSNPVVYVGTLFGVLCLLICVFSYVACYACIQMSKKTKHSLINTWISTMLLCLTFCFGIYQTENVRICQIVGLSLHYLTISTLLWMAVAVSILRKKLAKADPLDSSAEEELPLEQPIQKPLMGLYLVGWGVAFIVCGISGAVNIKEYAAYSYCFLAPNPAVTAVILPAVILIIFLVYSFLRLCCISKAPDTNGRLSEGTQATELDSTVGTAERVSLHSESAVTRSSDVEDTEHSPFAHLKAQAICLALYLLMWTSAAIAIICPFRQYILYEQLIFNTLYAFFCLALGFFILFFNCVARNDVRNGWKHLRCRKRHSRCCRTRSVSDTNPSLSVTHMPNVSDDPALRPTSSNSAHSSVRTKSARSNMMKIMTETNGVPKVSSTPTSDSSVRIASVNLVELHRRRYRTENKVLAVFDQSGTSGGEMFYNPYQSTVARKFFRKQRMRARSDFSTRRRGDGSGGTSDCDSNVKIQNVAFSNVKSTNNCHFPIDITVKVQNGNVNLNNLNTRAVNEDECSENSCIFPMHEEIVNVPSSPLERLVIGAEEIESAVPAPVQKDDTAVVSLGELSDVETDTDQLNRLMYITNSNKNLCAGKKLTKRRTISSRSSNVNSSGHCSKRNSDSDSVENDACETVSCSGNILSNEKRTASFSNKLSNNSLCSNAIKSTSSLGRNSSRPHTKHRPVRNIIDKTSCRSVRTPHTASMSCESSEIAKDVKKESSPTSSMKIVIDNDEFSLTKKETSV